MNQETKYVIELLRDARSAYNRANSAYAGRVWRIDWGARLLSVAEYLAKDLACKEGVVRVHEERIDQLEDIELELRGEIAKYKDAMAIARTELARQGVSW